MSEPFSSYPLTKEVAREMVIYLSNANPANLSASQWGVTTWQAAHGEGRSASSTTFHIGLRLAQGVYWTCILVQVRGRDVALAGTMRNWGNTAPSLPLVLQTYQREYIKTKAPAGSSQQDPSNNGGGGGAGGGSGGGGGDNNPPAWEKKVLPDAYGGHYYMDENDEYCACDAQGNQLRMNTPNGPTTNPYGILLVFKNSKGEYYLYSRGKRTLCQVQQDKATKRLFIVNDQRQKRNVQLYGSGSLPKWRAPRAPAPAQQPAQPSGGKTPSAKAPKAPSSKTPAATTPAAKAPVARQPLQAVQTVQYLTDPKTGRQYYMGSDGKAHWV